MSTGIETQGSAISTPTDRYSSTAAAGPARGAGPDTLDVASPTGPGRSGTQPSTVENGETRSPTSATGSDERAGDEQSSDPAGDRLSAGQAQSRAERDSKEAQRSGRIRHLVSSLGKVSATLIMLSLAVLASLVIWNYYVTAPWTRDGRVRVQVASIAPQVAGQIKEIHVVDNQFVHKGDVLYVIDPFDFQASLDTARTQVRQKAADLQVKRKMSERRQSLTTLSTTPEQQQQYAGDAVQAQAAFESAQVQVAQAEINFDRTRVTSPVNGYVTNLLMRVGDYARVGTTNVSVIDADSYWIDGYFEETKMAKVCVGDKAEAQLMGYNSPILGHVQTVTRGISVSDASVSTQGLPNVDPVYTWVRLAQRVPVRISITDVPPGVPLVSGMTATITIRKQVDETLTMSDRVSRAWADVETTLSHTRPAPDCIPDTGPRGSVTTLSTPQPTPPRSADEINPGLTPGMATKPR